MPSYSNVSPTLADPLKTGVQSIFNIPGYVQPDKLTGIDSGDVELKRNGEHHKMLIRLVTWKNGTFASVV